MSLISRVMNVAMRPAQEWPVIAEETASTSGLYTRYIIPLVAIGPVCAFGSALMFGQRVWFTNMSIHQSFSTLLSVLIVTYILSLVSVAVNAVIVQKLAPTFKSQGDFVAALKIVTFSYAPYWMASVLHLVPMLGMLSVLVAFYGLYLFHVGLPHVMKTPEEQRLPYLGIVVIVSIVIWFVLMGLPAVIVNGMMWMQG